MPSVRLSPAGVAALLLLGACRTEAPAPLTVALAYPRWAAGYVEVAESILVASYGDSIPRPRIVFDPDTLPERPERVVEWVQELLRDPSVRVIVGPSASHTALRVAPMVNRAGLPTIVPSATARQLAQSGPWLFRLAGNDSVEGAFLVQQILARPGLRRVLILYTNDEYGQGLRIGVAEALARTGLRPTAEIPVDLRSDFETLFRNEFARRPPDVILGAFRNVELAGAARALRGLGNRRPLFVGDGAFGPLAFHRAVGPVPFEVYGAALWLRNAGTPQARTYLETFTRLLGTPPRGEDAMIHDAIMLAATALREGRGDPHEIRRWLNELGVARPPYEGVTGPIEFRREDAHRFRLGRFVDDSAVAAELP